MEKSEVVLYLFCFARPEEARQVAASGVDERNPVLIFCPSAEVCAVIAEVAREDFCGPEAERRMEQLSWVGPRALRHEAVIEEVMEHSPVLPARFGTLFSSLPALTQFMDAHRAVIAQFLGRVAGQREWSVRGRFDRNRAQQARTAERLAAEPGQLSGLAEGTRYFAEKRFRHQAEQELGGWLEQALRQVVGELARHASDCRECAPLARERSDNQAEEVLNCAFLLPDSKAASFLQEVERANLEHAPKGLQFEPSGPWPPFRFVPALAGAEAP